MSENLVSKTRAAFVSGIASIDAITAEVFEDFSYNLDLSETQVSHSFEDQIPALIDKLVLIWHEAYPYIAKAADVGGVISIIVMIKDRNRDSEVRDLLEKVISELEKDKDN